MKATIKNHQFNLFIDILAKEYEIFGHKQVGNRIIFDKIDNPSELYLGLNRKTVIPFKKIIFPNHQDVKQNRSKKIALIGLNNCDVWALEKFLLELGSYSFVPKKEDLFVLAQECIEDEYCFCESMGTNQVNSLADAYLQKDRTNYLIFTFGKRAEKVLKLIGLKNESDLKITQTGCEKELEIKNAQKFSSIIDNRQAKEEIWQKLSDNCFGCGACTAVCPLCFCTRQDFENTTDGKCKLCLNWDTCFAKRFSEIQNHFDLRPKNVDRFYNWYHHKFVRAYHKNEHFLCVGCGRCARACPANLNIKSILKNLDKDEK